MAEFKLNRRGFLGVAGGTAIGVASASIAGPLAGTASAAMGVAAADTPSPAIGLQLYSVRNHVANLGFRVVFEELARLGFKEVEFAGYTQNTAILGRQITIAEIRTLLDANGLKAIGSHIGTNALVNAGQREAQYDIARQLGMPYIGTADDIPGGNTTAGIQAGAARFNDAAVAAKAGWGLEIYQHNHSNEFNWTSDQPGVRRYDVWGNSLNFAAGVFLEMDILWAFGGARKFATTTGPLPGGGFGFNPASYVAAHPERYHLFHVKDGTPTANPTSGNSFNDVEIGLGTIPFRAFFDTVGAKAVAHPLWEQDSGPNTPAAAGGAFGAAQRSYDNLFVIRTMSWLDELRDEVTALVAAGRVRAEVGDDLQGRLANATKRYEGGHEESAMGYLGQFIAKVNNQVKGDEAAKVMLMANAQIVLDWLQQSEDKENGVSAV